MQVQYSGVDTTEGLFFILGTSVLQQHNPSNDLLLSEPMNGPNPAKSCDLVLDQADTGRRALLAHIAIQVTIAGCEGRLTR